MKVLYCWRCKKDVPMLDEIEWDELYPHLIDHIETIKAYRQKHDATLEEAGVQHFEQGALDRYFAITGYRESDVWELWHHRLKEVGSPCTSCGKPLRTPHAKFCAECGAPKSSLGETIITDCIQASA